MCEVAMPLPRFAFVAALVIALPVLADPPTMHSAGTLDAKLGELGEKQITIKRLENEFSKAKRPVVVGKEVDHEYDLAPNVLLRRQELPKSKDGKGKTYTNEEYAKLREPLSAPGYKAERSEFKPGQTVRLFFTQESSKDRPVVATVMIIKEAPEPPAKKPDDKKK
jgi:hypothetical protein